VHVTESASCIGSSRSRRRRPAACVLWS
jgi:hypothetical protein